MLEKEQKQKQNTHNKTVTAAFKAVKKILFKKNPVFLSFSFYLLNYELIYLNKLFEIFSPPSEVSI